MVDALKGNSSVLRAAATVSTQSLRTNLKSLSSAKVVDTAAAKKSENVSSRSEKAAHAEKISGLLAGLNDAISHSSLALDSIKKVAEAGSGFDDHSAFSSLVGDLENIGGAVSQVLGVLRDHVDHAEVIKENISASTTRLTDLDAAHAQANETEAQIQFSSQQAVEAHEGLTPDRVARLLVES